MSEPSGADPHRSPPPWGWLIAGVLVLALIAGVGLAGGFREGRARLDRVAPGETFTAGPIELSIERAVVAKSESGDGWELTVFGHGRTTGDRTVGLPLNSLNVKAPDSDVLGAYRFSSGRGHAAVFNPGVPTFEFTVAFGFPDGAVPQKTVLVRVDKLKLDDTFRSQITDDTWVPAHGGHLVEVPVSVR